MNFETIQPSLSNKRNLVLLALFAALGVAISLGTYALSGGFERVGLGPMIAVIVLFVPVGILVLAGLREGLGYFSELRAAWTWWHWLFFLLIFSTLVFRIRDNSVASSNPLDAYAILRIGPEVIVIAILWLRLRNRETTWRRSLFRGLVGVLAVFGIVCLISSVWSVYPAWTLYKSVEMLLDISTVAAILATNPSAADIRKVCNWVFVLYGLDLVVAWGGAAVWPSECLDELGRLSSVWPVISSNSLGSSSAVVALVALARLVSRRQGKTGRAWYILLLAAGLITLIASQTRNSMAGFIFGAFLIFVYERKIWVPILGLVGSIPLMMFTSLGPGVIQFLSRDQTESQITHMSARVDWWTFAWQQFMQRPFTGYGAFAAGKFAVLSKIGIEASQIHSDWMEILTGESFWGLVPFTVAVIGTWWIIGRSYSDRSLSADERQWLPEIAGIFGAITVRSFFNVEMSWHAPFLFLAIVCYAEFLRRKRNQPVADLNRSPSVIEPVRENLIPREV
jgi:O-antigen ligase